MPQQWQEIDAQWLACHWWQDVTRSILTAMSILTFLVTVLAVLAMAFVVFTVVHLVSTDGLQGSRRTPPRSHHTDMFDPHTFA